MIEEVSTYDAKTKFSEIIRHLREEEQIYRITYHGKPVATLTPYRPDDDVSDAIQILKNMPGSGVSTEDILEMIEDGRA